MIETKCPNNIMGTINVGKRLNGKFKIAMLGCSNANFWIGEGAENNARITMFNKSPKQIKFQTKISYLLNFVFVIPK